MGSPLLVGVQIGVGVVIGSAIGMKLVTWMGLGSSVKVKT